MRFHQQEDKEVQYLCGFLVKLDIPLLHWTKRKPNKIVPLLPQTLESDFLWYLLEKAIWIKSLTAKWERPKMGIQNKEKKIKFDTE